MSDRPQTHRPVVSYIDKSREFYAAHGYEQPYRWAGYEQVPVIRWHDRDGDLADATIGVVTTTFPIGFTEPTQVYAQASSPGREQQAAHKAKVGT